GDGTFSYFNEDGVTVTFDANTTSVSVVDGAYTFYDGTGSTLTVIDTNAYAIAIDNTDIIGVTATDVQVALEQLSQLIDDIEDSARRSSDLGDGTFSYFNEDGVTVTFDAN